MAWLSSTKCRGTHKVLQKASGDPAPGAIQPIPYKEAQTDSSLVAIVAYEAWPEQDMIQGFRQSIRKPGAGVEYNKAARQIQNILKQLRFCCSFVAYGK